jgi:hypothetical protein
VPTDTQTSSPVAGTTSPTSEPSRAEESPSEGAA